MNQDYTLPGVLQARAIDVPDMEAVVAPDGRLTYRELNAAVGELRNDFAARGIRRGDRVGILLTNGWRWVATALAVHSVGASVVAINTFSRESELAFTVMKSRMRMLISERQIFGFDVEKAGAELLSAEGQPLSMAFWDGNELSGSPDGPHPAIADLSLPEDEGYLLFTSGSSAEPKALVLHQRNLVRNGQAMGDRQKLVPADRIWFASPMFFSFGCANVLPVALTHSATLCLQARFETESALRFIEAERCTSYYGLSFATRSIVEFEGRDKYDISSLRTGVTGFSAEDKRLAIEELGVTQVCSVYGLSESYGLTTMTEAGDPKEVILNTQGRPLPTIELRIMREDGAPAQPGETGGVEIRGCVTTGYVDNPEMNQKAFGSDGWFRTGDLGFLDEDGRMHFVARNSEMMKVKGANVAPAEIEAVLENHPAISQSYVFSIPDERYGDMIGCAVQLHNPADTVTTAEGIRNWLKERTAAYKVPSVLEIVTTTDLPLTNTGKVNRRVLASQIADRFRATATGKTRTL